MTSSKEIEREVESQRASVESTLDALKQKMSLGQMADEIGAYVGADDAKAAFRNVGRQVRDNPIALGLVGVGLAWLMFGGGSSRSDYADDRYDRDWDEDRYRRDADTGFANVGRASPGVGGADYGSAYGSPYAEDRGERSSGEGMLSRAKSAVSETLHTVGEKLADAGGSVSGAVSGAGDKLRSAGDAGARRMHGARDEVSSRMPSTRAMSDQGRRMAGSLVDSIDRQPLMAGAFAMAAGVAIGAALPSTRTEDRWLGEGRDDLIAGAKGAAKDLQHQAVDAAKAGLRAASDAASEEGLTPDTGGKTIAARGRDGGQGRRRRDQAQPRSGPGRGSGDRRAAPELTLLRPEPQKGPVRRDWPCRFSELRRNCSKDRRLAACRGAFFRRPGSGEFALPGTNSPCPELGSEVDRCSIGLPVRQNRN